MEERFPLPRFFICKPGDSNERKIKVRVNPSSLTAQNATVEVRIKIVLFICRVEIISQRMSVSAYSCNILLGWQFSPENITL